MSMLKEFRDFAIKGNVVDLAIGVIIGAALGTIVSSLVDDVFDAGSSVSSWAGSDFSNLFRRPEQSEQRCSVIPRSCEGWRRHA